MSHRAGVGDLLANGRSPEEAVITAEDVRTLATRLEVVKTSLASLDETTRKGLLATKAGAGCATLVLETAVELIKSIDRLAKNAPRVGALAEQVKENGAGSTLFLAPTLQESYDAAAELQQQVDTFGFWADKATGFYAESHDHLTALAKWTSDQVTATQGRMNQASDLGDGSAAQQIVNTTGGIQVWLDELNRGVAAHNRTWTAGFETWGKDADNPEASRGHLLLHTQITDHLARTTTHIWAARRVCENVIQHWLP